MDGRPPFIVRPHVRRRIDILHDAGVVDVDPRHPAELRSISERAPASPVSDESASRCRREKPTGWPRCPRYDGATISAPDATASAIARIVAGAIHGMSPSEMIQPSASTVAAIPHASVALIPSPAFTHGTTRSPASLKCAASRASRGRTTAIESGIANQVARCRDADWHVDGPPAGASRSARAACRRRSAQCSRMARETTERTPSSDMSGRR